MRHPKNINIHSPIPVGTPITRLRCSSSQEGVEEGEGVTVDVGDGAVEKRNQGERERGREREREEAIRKIVHILYKHKQDYSKV